MMRFFFACISVFLIFLLVFPSAAEAQSSCNPERPHCANIDGSLCRQLGGTTEACTKNVSVTGNNQLSLEGNCCIPDVPTPSPPVTPVPPPQGPHPEQFIPCEDTTDGTDQSEYHTLRPYQANPCNTDLAGSGLKLYCANDLLIHDEITATPNGPEDVECTDNGSTISCDYEIQREVEVSISVDDAELPILGNTQLVPNQVNNGYPVIEDGGNLEVYQMSWAQRMNEYLNWWLHGAPFKADEELYDPDEINLEYPYRHIYTYGGPLRNLYPKDVQRDKRAVQISSTRGSRHDQVYLCRHAGIEVPCRYDFDSGDYLVDVNNTPNDKTDDERAEYKRLSSASVTSQWVPLASTEDLIGTIYLDPTGTIQPTADEGNDVDISEITYDLSNDTELLFFPHIEGNIELTNILQDTFTSKTIAGAKGFAYNSEPRVSYNTKRCDLEDVRWNTGDDLFGELDSTSLGTITNPEGQEITGESIEATFEYVAKFNCEFPKNTPGGYNGCVASCGGSISCIDNCASTRDSCLNACGNPPNPTACTDKCWNGSQQPQECTKNAYFATSVYTRTPKAEELWDRTVSGKASLVRKMYPKFTEKTGMFEEIKALPGVSTANYSADSGDVYAGKIEMKRSGDRAELYFPYLGGIYEYAMHGIQDILRPQAMNSRYLSNGLPPGSGDITGACDMAPSGPCAPENLAKYFTGSEAEKLQKGRNASMICWRESRGNQNALNDSCKNSLDGKDNDGDGCYDLEDYEGSPAGQCTPRTIAGTDYYFDGATVDLSIGLFQHSLLALGLCGLREGTHWGWTNPPGCSGPGCSAPWCTYNGSQVQQCIDDYKDAEFNILEMVRRSDDGTSWGPWCSTDPTWRANHGCGLCG